MSGSQSVTAEDLVLMQQLAQRVAAFRPELVNGDASYGELAWVWGKGHAAYGDTWRRRLWFGNGADEAGSGGELVAWAWATVPGNDDASLTYQVHPDRAGLVDEVIAWFEDAAPDADRRVIPRAVDSYAQQRWTAAGYEPDLEDLGDDGSWYCYSERPLDDLPEPDLPDGFRFRTAAEVGPEAAAQAHIDAWYPSAYTLEAAEDVSHTAAYRADLHPVVEAEDGTMAATAIMWLDEANRTAEFEPVGTHLGYRRLGLARAMLLHGMRLAREAGATRMTVGCEGRPGNPALRLYESLGFKEFTRDASMIKWSG